ncbi:hypothetical protein [Sphingomicrobium aquimarinum]|uniref:hypothetical protein n=1 Tax=Sphingomicrobium aquimarinum TaxID=3133971 RepID=UPI003D72BF25
MLGIGNRQFRRRKARYLDEGPAGLISKKVGRPAANKIDPRIVEDAAALLRTIYADFSPKQAALLCYL